MVVKLIKHEFKEASRRFVPILGMIVAASIILALSFNMEAIYNEGMILVMLMLILMGLGIAVVVMSFMAFIDLLYTSLYNKNGYRLFTLPVETWEIIVAKISVYAIWNAIVGITTLLAFIFITAVTVDLSEVWLIVDSIILFIKEVIEFRVVLVGILSTLTSSLLTLSLFLLVGSIVNSHYVQNHRGIKMFIGYLISYVLLNQIMMQLGSGLATSINVSLDPNFLNNANAFNPLIQGWGAMFDVSTNLSGLRTLSMFSVLNFSVSMLFLFGTTWFWNNKLEIID